MNYSYGFEIEGMAFESDYENIKDYLRTCEENYFITGDESVHIDDDLIDFSYSQDREIEDIIPFEIHLGPFIHTAPVTSQTIVQKNLINLANLGLISNNTCALHIHIKPLEFELYSKESHWSSHLMTSYLIETNKYRRLLYHNNQKMYHQFWASVSDMMKEYKELNEQLEVNPNYFLEKRKIIFGKRGLLHCHSQGTLEWRGVRGMFDNKPATYFGKTNEHYLDSIRQKINFVYTIFELLEDAFNQEKKNVLYKTHYQLLGMEKNVLV